MTGVSDAEMVTSLRERYELSWAQLAKLFGVSPTLVHLWSNGRQMNSGHQEIMLRLTSALLAVPGDTPHERHLALFRLYYPKGSLYDQLRAMRYETAEEINGSPYSWDNLLGD